MNPCYSAILALALALLTACGQTSGPAGLVLEGAWVRSPPPGAAMLAAYGRLSNTGPTAVDIVDFTSDGFDEISLHETTIENDVANTFSTLSA